MSFLGFLSSLFLAGSKVVEEIMKKAKVKGVKLHFPIDIKITRDFGKSSSVCSVQQFNQ
jgi:hypothetical protein